MLNKNTVEIWQFPNIGYISDTVPKNIFNTVKTETEEILKDFTKSQTYNKDLVGHIDKEFAMPNSMPILDPYVQELSYAYANCFKYELPPLKLASLWVNYQQKHEFNPIHDHRSLMSFVIWVKIPFTKENEAEIFKKSNEQPVSGQFHFVYTNSLGDINSYSPQEKEGMIAIFPSQMKHMVYPFFTSDDYRISVAGNLIAQ